jgi:hypothetical protein
MKDMKKKMPMKKDKDMGKKEAGYMKGGMVKGKTKADAKGMKKKPGYK